MTILINLYAFLVLLLFAGITFLMHLISPEFSDSGHPFFWLLLVLTSGALENIGIRGRIFRVPIWVLGLVAYIFTTKSYYSETGSLLGVYLVILVLIAGIIINGFANRKRWERAEKSLSDLKSLYERGVQAETIFKKLKTAFYIPNYLNADNYFQNLIFGRIYDIKYRSWFAKPNVNLHYLEFFDILKKLVKEEEFKKYAVLLQASIKNVETKKMFSIDTNMFESVLSLIERREKEYVYQLNKVKESIK